MMVKQLITCSMHMAEKDRRNIVTVKMHQFCYGYTGGGGTKKRGHSLELYKLYV